MYVFLKIKISTIDSGVVDQDVNPPERMPRFLHARLDGRAVGCNVELHGYSSIRTNSVDSVAKGVKPVGSTSGGNDYAAGFGEVEAEFEAGAGGCASDHDDFALELRPWLKLVRDFSCHFGVKKRFKFCFYFLMHMSSKAEILL